VADQTAPRLGEFRRDIEQYTERAEVVTWQHKID